MRKLQRNVSFNSTLDGTAMLETRTADDKLERGETGKDVAHCTFAWKPGVKERKWTCHLVLAYRQLTKTDGLEVNWSAHSLARTCLYSKCTIPPQTGANTGNGSSWHARAEIRTQDALNICTSHTQSVKSMPKDPGPGSLQLLRAVLLYSA